MVLIPQRASPFPAEQPRSGTLARGVGAAMLLATHYLPGGGETRLPG
ncbi:hypothetical protein E2C01_082963 [Portunus trituberculatus]|uniref:Uncharacterized protein n=1 Tax=Portunus trituberculatus TaxID=210409 RepID=A0A5B7J0P1_PORTR|nr:hypothetical protein [Portunus trituberculatus]